MKNLRDQVGPDRALNTFDAGGDVPGVVLLSLSQSTGVPRP